MNQILTDNLDAIKIKSPRSAAFLGTYSIKEQPDLSYNTRRKLCVKRHGIALHSFYEPEKEAVKNRELFIAQNPDSSTKSLIILGAGIFYHVKEFQPYYTNLIIFEPDTDLLLSIISQCELQDVLSNCRIILAMNQESELESLKKDGTLKDNEFLIYRHAPSNRFYEAVYNDFTNLLRSKNTSINLKLKILIAGPVYGGSLPVYYYCKKALEELGHEVIGLDFSIHHQAMDFFDKIAVLPENRHKMMSRFAQNLSETILVSAIENEVDLVFGIAQAPFTSGVISELKKRKIITAFWFVEDFRTLLYWQNFAGLYDHFFVIQKDDFYSELKKIGCKNYSYLPMAANLDIHKKISLNADEKELYGSQLSFIGAGYYNRRRAFLSLLNYDFKIWGNDWDLHTSLANLVQSNGRRVSTEETVKIFNASTINLNLHSSSYVEDVNPDGDFVNPRTFEIAASENFQLVDHRSLLTDLYKDDEISTYKSLEDLKTQILYYLNHPDEREKIVKKSYLRTISAHTYKHRMQEMIKIIAVKHSQLSTRKSWEGNRSAYIQRAKAANLPELTTLFSEIGEEDITLEKVIEHIKNRKIPLDRTGGIFVMMQEFWNFAKRKKII